LSDNAIDLVADKIAEKVNIKAIDAHVKKFDPTANKVRLKLFLPFLTVIFILSLTDFSASARAL